MDVNKTKNAIALSFFYVGGILQLKPGEKNLGKKVKKKGQRINDQVVKIDSSQSEVIS